MHRKASASMFELEQLSEQNKHLEFKVQQLESERQNFISNMTTLIAKNDELEQEVAVLGRALELQDITMQDTQQLKQVQMLLQNEHSKTKELEFMRE